MKNIHIYIENASGSSGRMPGKADIMAALKSDPGSRKIVEAIEAGDIVLTGTNDREAVWAYEKNAKTAGGWVVTSSGPERMSAQQAQQRIGG